MDELKLKLKLYLAHYTLRVTEYMGKTTYSKGIRLVWATDETMARAKMDAEYEHCAPGDNSCFVDDVFFEEAL
jgi:hypothetical protein